MSSKESQLYVVKLESILTSKKLFLKQDFSMPELAQETGIPLHIISYVVNSELNLRFTDYINLKRIEYFKQKSKDPLWKDLTVKEMTENCGFKCRTTCYRAFVKHLQVTPAQYVESYKKV
jgi:AraC-like DNA-binding protein